MPARMTASMAHAIDGFERRRSKHLAAAPTRPLPPPPQQPEPSHTERVRSYLAGRTTARAAAWQRSVAAAKRARRLTPTHSPTPGPGLGCATAVELWAFVATVAWHEEGIVDIIVGFVVAKDHRQVLLSFRLALSVRLALCVALSLSVSLCRSLCRSAPPPACLCTAVAVTMWR